MNMYFFNKLQSVNVLKNVVVLPRLLVVTMCVKWCL